MTEKKTPEPKKIVSTKDFSLQLVTYEDGTVGIESIVTVMNDFEVIGIFTLLSSIMQAKYSGHDKRTQNDQP